MGGSTGVSRECVRHDSVGVVSHVRPAVPRASAGCSDEVGAAGSAPSLDRAGFVVPPQLAVALACVVLAHIMFARRRSLTRIRHEQQVLGTRARAVSPVNELWATREHTDRAPWEGPDPGWGTLHSWERDAAAPDSLYFFFAYRRFSSEKERAN